MCEVSMFPAATPVPASAHTQISIEPALSPSKLFCTEARVHYHGSWPEAKKPQSTDVAQTCTCVMCGAVLHPFMEPPHKAIPATKELFGDSFNNKIDLKAGTVVCSDCETLWAGEFMQTHSKSYAIAGRGVFRLASSLNIAAFVLHSPPAPYVAIFNTRKQGHLIWRTPVQYPGPDLTVRLDDELVSINRDRVMSAVRAWQFIKSRMQALKLKTKEPALLSSSLSFGATGLILPTIEIAMGKDGATSQDALKVLKSLTMGDWWALCAMRDIDMDDQKNWPPEQQISPIMVGIPSKKLLDVQTDLNDPEGA